MKRILSSVCSFLIVSINGLAIVLSLDSEKYSFDYSWAAFLSFLLGILLLVLWISPVRE